MGCCLSTRDHRKPELRHRDGGASPRSPPATLEEETVKEVLLETPIVPKAVENVREMPALNAQVGSTAAINRSQNRAVTTNEEIISEVSQASEMGNSVGESLSNTTAYERRDGDGEDEDGEVNQRPPARKRRRPDGGRGRGRGRVSSQRPPAPSPEKKGQVAPLRPSRGRPVVAQPRNAVEVNGRRRDLGEGSGRRSRSPERSEDVGTQRDVGEDKSVSTPEPPDAAVAAAEEVESLENPVVSLECFIFL